MALETPEVDLTGIRDPQRPVAVAVGVVLVLLGIAGLTGIMDYDYLGDGLVLGVFGVPFWLGVTAIVAGLLGVLLASYPGGATTFDKLAAGIVLPAVFFLAVTDWGLATGGIVVLALGLVALLLAVVFAAIGTVLLLGHPLALVLPVVAILAILDWVFGITAMLPTESANLPTLGLLVVLTLLVGVIGFEGGKRLTGRPIR